MFFWRIALRNVEKNWRHSISALLSLSASFVSLVLFDGYIADLKDMYEDSFRHRSMLGDLIVEKPEIHKKRGLANPWMFQITQQEQKDIEDFLKKQSSYVEERVRFLAFQASITNGSQSSIVMGRGIDTLEGEKVRGTNWSWNTTFGEPLHKSPVSNATIIGQGLAKKINCSWNEKDKVYAFKGGYEAVSRPFECSSLDIQISAMTEKSQLNAMDLNIVGLLDAGYRDIDDRYLVTDIPTAQALLDTTNVSMVTVMLKDSGKKTEFMNLFNQEINKKYPEIKIMPWAQHLAGETYLKTMELLAVFRNFVVIVILVISTLSVANTLIKIIKERSREIGTLRSIGFKVSEVVRMFFYETFLLSIIGSTIGIIIALITGSILNLAHIRNQAGMLSEPVLFKIKFNGTDYLEAFLILLGVSLIACFWATRSETKKKIIENLTHV